uniref:Uncharacterized protein n=1 Tax=Arundo donax TaxID=35708 RepID=A0A0A9FLZ8_ARUDO
MIEIKRNITRINHKLERNRITFDNLIKKKEKRETNSKAKAFASIGRWVSEDKGSSSSDESYTITSSKKNSSSTSSSHKTSLRRSHKCLIAKGIDSDVSDEESDDDSSSQQKLFNLINKQQRTLKKQSKELKKFNALSDIHATFVTNYEELLDKFNLLNNEHEELKVKLKGIEQILRVL